MSRITIFGGSGFIGTNLASELKKQSHEVINFDRRDKENPRDILTAQVPLDDCVKEADVVFHLAAIPAHRLSVNSPFEIINNNYLTTLHIAEACRKFNKKLIYASSFSVYGNQRVPWQETDALHSHTPYSHCKIACEDMLKVYHRLYGLKVIICRLSNVYGEFEELHQPLQVLPIWLKCRKEKKPLKVYGEKTTRDFTHVQDIISALILLMDKDGLDIYNVCCGKERRLIDIARLISEKIEILPLPEYEAIRWVGDNSKLKRLGWKPQFDVIDYVKEAIK